MSYVVDIRAYVPDSSKLAAIGYILPRHSEANVRLCLIGVDAVA